MAARALPVSCQRAPLQPATARRGLAPTLQQRVSSSRNRAQLRPVAAAVGTQATQQQQQPPPPPPPPPPPSAKRAALKNPANLSASMQSSIPVPDRGGLISLDQYTRLPPEQYNELDPAMIKALGGSSFLLKVPRLTLFNVWVEPEVVVSVRLAEGSPGVIFEAGECTLRGSDLLTQLGLDRRFVLYFHTLLTWQPGSKAAPGTAPSTSGSSNGGGTSGSSNGGPEASSKVVGSTSGTNGTLSNPGTISAKADVQVWTEVVGLFQAIPRPILEGTGSSVVNALLQALLPIFMNLLADDYKRWSTDPGYRARRAAAQSVPQVQL